MKTKKLNLSNLKVESFVTSLENQKTNTVKGGSSGACVTISAASVVLSAITYYLCPQIPDPKKNK